jgi:phage antirepressor YoqD-like protein
MNNIDNETNINVEPWFEMVVVAKMMEKNVGRNTIFKKLREDGYLMEGNIPYQAFRNKDLFKMDLRPRYDSRQQILQWYAVTLVSPKGIDLIKKIVKEEEVEGEQQ